MCNCADCSRGSNRARYQYEVTLHGVDFRVRSFDGLSWEALDTCGRLVVRCMGVSELLHGMVQHAETLEKVAV